MQQTDNHGEEENRDRGPPNPAVAQGNGEQCGGEPEKGKSEAQPHHLLRNCAMAERNSEVCLARALIRAPSAIPSENEIASSS